MPLQRDLHPIRSEKEYDQVVAELDRLLDKNPAPGSAGEGRLEVLGLLVEAYDDKHYPMPGRSTPQSIVGFVLERGPVWELIAATGIIITIPMFFFALIIQRHFTKGMTLGAVR